MCANRLRASILFLVFLLLGFGARAQRGHRLTIRTEDSAGLYLYVGGQLMNKTPQKEVVLTGLRRSVIDVEVAPTANETASIRSRITLIGLRNGKKESGFRDVVYELVPADDGYYELHIVAHEPIENMQQSAAIRRPKAAAEKTGTPVLN